MPDCAVLVVNWSTPGDLDRCLSSLRTHEGMDVPLLVRQNRHSPEVDVESEQIARRWGAEVILTGPNVGHGAGMNLLAPLTDAEYLFLVNPDCAWTEPVIEDLVSFLEADPDAAVVGPKQRDSRQRITAGGIGGTLAAPQHRSFHAADPMNRLHRDIFPSTVVAGSAFMISAVDFKEYGGLLEAKHYYSETWLCYHLQAHGRTVWYWGEPHMIHEWHRSSPRGFAGTDGKFKEDQALFRKMCDEHDPPIPHD